MSEPKLVCSECGSEPGWSKVDAYVAGEVRLIERQLHCGECGAHFTTALFASDRYLDRLDLEDTPPWLSPEKA